VVSKRKLDLAVLAFQGKAVLISVRVCCVHLSLCVCVCERERERDRQTDRQTETER
jgi:hypothetical protein